MKNIDDILKKYFEGETTLEEERLLRKYFASGNMDQKYNVYLPIFQYIEHKNKKAVRKAAKQAEAVKQEKRNRIALWVVLAGACASTLFAIFATNLLSPPDINNTSNSYVYVDGEKHKDINEINIQALNSLAALDADANDDDIFEYQIDILDSFIEMK